MLQTRSAVTGTVNTLTRLTGSGKGLRFLFFYVSLTTVGVIIITIKFALATVYQSEVLHVFMCCQEGCKKLKLHILLIRYPS